MRLPTMCHYRLKVSSVHQLGFHLCRHCNHRLRVGWYTHQPSLIVECNTCSRRPPYESRSHFNVAPRNYGSSTAVEESSFPKKNPIPLGITPVHVRPTVDNHKVHKGKHKYLFVSSRTKYFGSLYPSSRPVWPHCGCSLTVCSKMSHDSSS